MTLRADVDGLGAGAPTRPFMTFYDGPTRLGVGRVTVLGAGQETIAIGTLFHGTSCALTSIGGVKCWGENTRGQVGGGTTTQVIRTAVDVVGLTSGVVAVTLGRGHTCALTSVGGVKCWGNNEFGQLGNGQTINRRVPVDVAGMKQGILAISAGGEHTCALTRVGDVRCWGRNQFGELGDGGSNHSLTTYSPLPINVTGLTSGVVTVNSSDAHTCALTRAGGVKCWGYNAHGELGNGTTTNSSSPVDVSGFASGAVAIGGKGHHTCAITGASGLKCWWYNGDGELGDGTTTDRLTPVNVLGLTSGVAAVAGSTPHTCALTIAGGVKCWGYNIWGELGDGSLTSGAVVISASYTHSCALMSSGGVKCWGANGAGQLGDGSQDSSSTPVSTKDFAGLVRARAYFTTSPLASGLHVMRAFYSDDARHTGSSAGWGQTVR